MPRSSAIYDVFISHSAIDKQANDLARKIAEACDAKGWKTFVDYSTTPGQDFADALREALSESRAVVVIVSRHGLTPPMAIELGGARAWNKPLFGVLTDPSQPPPPTALGDIHLYTPSRIDDLVRAIGRSGEDLSEPDREALATAYAEAGVAVDQLALEPRVLETLVKRFHRLTAKAVTGERLLSELLRMRKQGKLATGVRTHRSRRHKETG